MAMLAVENLSKAFGGVKAVDQCSFSLEEGQITALIGPNGAGKTTVFNLVNGFLAPDAGRIVFQGQDVTRRAAWERSRLGMSRTFQLSRFFRNLTLRQNLVLAIRQDDDRFWKMLWDRSSLHDFDERIQTAMEFVGFRKDLDTMITELSYGEQKLFDLTRAFLNPHTVLLLDEPVAGLNPVIREKLTAVMKKFREGSETVLLIEHDIPFVRDVADRVIVLHQGRVLTEGSPEIVLRDPQVLNVYLGSS